MKNWFRIENKADSKAEVMLYGDIGAYGITAADFRSDLYSCNCKEIALRVSSRGGDVFEGIAIYNALREHPAKITAYIDSLAASIASFIPMAADHRVMASNARIMIHKAWCMGIGNATEFKSLVERLEDADSILVDGYSKVSGMDASDIELLMSDETWMNPSKAKALGFINEISGDSNTNAKYDLSPFNKVPEDVKSLLGKTDASTRDIEHLLRDAGVSSIAAKAAISALKKADQRDAGEDIEAEVVKMKEYRQLQELKTIITT